MKHKIYIVHESIGVMGEIRQQIVKAFACKRTAKKFVDYKNLKLAELKKKFEHFDPELQSNHHSKIAETKIKRFISVYSTNEYFLKEVELYQ
ncbi:MAG: hypothetical protein ACKOW2_04325 [Sphingobacteriaceae bacterium]